MPLIHSKKPAAFSKSVQRKAQHHKMGHGGSVEDCPHCMDEGGQVDSPGWKAKGWTHDKDYNEGVHRDVSGKGESYTGTLVRKGLTERAIDRQKSQMSHNAASPSPKLKGLYEGGEVEMDEDHDLHDAVGEELMNAIHSKDHKKMMSGIEAMVLHHMNKGKD
jgi:hypothetical protein